MNTVLTFRKSDYSLHVTHRSDEFRIVINDKKFKKGTIMSYFSIEDLINIKNSNANLIETTHNERSPLQYSKVAEKTTLDKSNCQISVVVENVVHTYSLTETEWQNFFNYMLNGTEGKVL